MNRRIVLIASLAVGLLLTVATLAILMCCNRGSEVSVSFLNAESSNGQFPSYIKSERLNFAVRNAGPKAASVQVLEIQDEQGAWVKSLHLLGGVDPGQNTQLYLYVPAESPRPRSVRIRVFEKASAVQKSRYALGLLIQRASGRYSGKQLWFDGLRLPAYDLVLKLDKDA